MIKILRLKKAIYLIVLGVIGLVIFRIMEVNDIESAIYVLRLSGILFLVGAAWSLYPILVAKKINDKEVQLDPTKQEEVIGVSVKEEGGVSIGAVKSEKDVV